MTRFIWPAYPTSDSEFESLMSSIDAALAAQGLTPFQRPLHVCRKFWEAFGWEGRITPPESLADHAGFTGDILMAKAHRWYQHTYCDQLKGDWALGYVPARLGNALWKMRIAVWYGSLILFIDRNLGNRGQPMGGKVVEASVNVLCEIEGLPQGLVDKLPDQVLAEHLQFHQFAMNVLAWRDQLPKTELFATAKGDYDQCTQEVLGRRFSQALWAAQQATEKTIKGLLSIAGTAFPDKGAKGHDLKILADICKSNHNIDIPQPLLELASCPTDVRYGKKEVTETQAVNANHAVLCILEYLSNCLSVEIILKAEQGISN